MKFLCLAICLCVSVHAGWMEEQIAEDFAQFEKREDVHIDGHMHVGYAIADGQVCVRDDVKHERCEAVTKALVEVCESYVLPDCEFVVCLEDSCEEAVLVFAKERGGKGILIPDFEALGGYGKVLREVESGNQRFPWEKKVNCAIWRGGSSGTLRTKLVEISMKHPRAVDARLNRLVQVGGEQKREWIRKGYFGSSLLLQDHLKYKYQILADGNTCAYSKAFWGWFCNSVVFKQESKNIQWYYGSLKPFVHYIPVAEDFSDLVDKIQWANEHEEEVRGIVANTNLFAKKNLSHAQVMHYFYLVLKQYSSLQ